MKRNRKGKKSEDWNLDQKDVQLVKETEYAVLVGVILQNQTEEQVQEYLDEAEFLAFTAGAKVIKRFTQRLEHPDTRTFIRKGKLQEIAEYVEAHEEITLVIFDDDLSGKQHRNIEEVLEVKILDRSTLILDIFAERAQTAQAKTQVELAQMQYLLPRLRGMWSHLKRQKGGIGMRGPGEKEIETDRRIVRYRIDLLKKELLKIDKQSRTRRKNRGQLIRISLVGYTNVGKSTILNLLAKSKVFAENKLFATLDTTVRKIAYEGVPFLMADTVGFIRKLPHHLIESFNSTLDEVRESDILVHVVDIAHPQFEEQLKTVDTTLENLGVVEKPTLLLFNKMDLYRKRNFDAMLDKATKAELEEGLLENMKNNHPDVEVLFISAKESENIDQLRKVITKMVKKQYVIQYPHIAKRW